MTKQYGPDRLLEQFRKPQSEIEATVAEMRKTGKYSIVRATDNGGLLAVEMSSFMHKLVEIEAAEFLAEAGYHVVLKNEMGQIITPDGYIYKFSYEQKTPHPPAQEGIGDGRRAIVKAMEHAKKKRADVVVIYDKYNLFHRSDIEKGIMAYEDLNKYRLKRVIVVSSYGNVYEHSHNKDRKNGG